MNLSPSFSRLGAPLAFAALLAIAGSGGVAQAQASCATDLSALQGQVQSQSLQPMLSETIDEIVADSGGLDQAIANAQQEIATLSTERDQLPPDTPADQVQLFNDNILIVQTGLDALQCRKNAGA